MGLNSSNKSAMTAMEKWGPKDSPGIAGGHQTHYPITAGGAGLAKPKKTGGSGGGKKKRKTWYEGTPKLKDGKYFSVKGNTRKFSPEYVMEKLP